MADPQAVCCRSSKTILRLPHMKPKNDRQTYRTTGCGKLTSFFIFYIFIQKRKLACRTLYKMNMCMATVHYLHKQEPAAIIIESIRALPLSTQHVHLMIAE
jgi:hypothetical protein